MVIFLLKKDYFILWIFHYPILPQVLPEKKLRLEKWSEKIFISYNIALFAVPHFFVGRMGHILYCKSTDCGWGLITSSVAALSRNCHQLVATITLSCVGDNLLYVFKWETVNWYVISSTEAEFLNVIGTKVLRVFLLAIHSHLYYGFYIPPLETGL
jgi:hypothetical protein